MLCYSSPPTFYRFPVCLTPPLLHRSPAIFLCHCLSPPPHSTAISKPLCFSASPVGDENTQDALLCQRAPLGRGKMNADSRRTTLYSVHQKDVSLNGGNLKQIGSACTKHKHWVAALFMNFLPLINISFIQAPASTASAMLVVVSAVREALCLFYGLS